MTAMSRLRTWVDFNHRAKKFEVACLVVQNLILICVFLMAIWWTDMYYYYVTSIHDNSFYLNIFSYFPKEFRFYL